ncbi:hypothetical protein EV182_003143 [Spiromyces aspiralis]|uniref:Uncharacterized protein n=1 Tax=Spiromyces aspiralis TaxID=68401 RepID=A0ACC1HES3_9FUNG|nr:hypothetical protein EV182_003143 [Spiromyces aspiralis]
MLQRRADDTGLDGISSGNTAWVLASTALVFIMIPGLGYFYSGMVRSKNAVSLVLLCTMAMAVVAIQWAIWGYSLAFSHTAKSAVIGNLHNFMLLRLEETTHPNASTIPESLYMLFQGLFAALTCALTVGAAAERMRIMPCVPYFFLWTTLVYCPIAYWTWSRRGFLSLLGVLDFAGGTPVEVCSGFSALANSLVLGKRHGYGEEQFAPHNFLNILLGTALLWFGWFGFNSGSVVAADGRAGIAMVTTHLAGSVAGVTWALIAYFRFDRKLSSFHFCSGVVSGLVSITPAAGFVSPWAAMVFGVVSGVVCHFAVDLKEKLHFDDALDVFAVHGMGGVVGNLLTGIFADKEVALLSGMTIKGGWMNRNWKQFPIQMASTAAGGLWAFGMTFIILYLMNLVPFLRMRVPQEAEVTGLDLAEMGEAGYGYFGPHFHPKVTQVRSGTASFTLGDSNGGSTMGIDYLRRFQSDPPREYSPSDSEKIHPNYPTKPPRVGTAPPPLGKDLDQSPEE